MKAKAIIAILLTLSLTSLGIAQSNDAKAKFNAGLTANQAGKYAEAEKDLLEAVKLEPTYKQAWVELGTAQLHLKKLPQSEEAFKMVVSLYVNAVVGQKNLGLVQL